MGSARTVRQRAYGAAQAEQQDGKVIHALDAHTQLLSRAESIGDLAAVGFRRR
jgi:hypothetical protein